MTSCPYCGRANDAAAAFCMDCGKPLTKAAAQSRARSSAAAGVTPAGGTPVSPATPLPHPSMSPVPNTRVSGAVAPDAPAQLVQTGCPFCGKAVTGALPFCPHCGRRLSAPGLWTRVRPVRVTGGPGPLVLRHLRGPGVVDPLPATSIVPAGHPDRFQLRPQSPGRERQTGSAVRTARDGHRHRTAGRRYPFPR